jgi:hypothetical protein
MPISFNCPHCHKPLKVKDALAGKKGPCPLCHKVLTVPAPSAAPATPVPKPAAPPPASPPPPAPAPAVDVEAEAAALFADGPARAEAPPQFIDFPCPYCDEPLHLDAALAGKKTPCPSCRRIISVPLPKVEKKDWRDVDKRLPSGAQRPTEPAPEGAWSSTATSRVSREALDEAGLIPDKRPPRTTGQKVRRGLLVAGGVAAVALLAFVGWRWWASRGQERALQQALSFANSDAAAQRVGKAGQAALHTGAGTYYLRTGKPQCGKLAAEQLGKALDLLNKDSAAGDREIALTELALAFVDLGGGPQDLEREKRLKWEDALRRVKATLSAIPPGDVRLEALRGVVGRLIAAGQAASVLPLVNQVYSGEGPADQAEALAVAGLAALGPDRHLAEHAANQALAFYAVEGQPRPRLRAPVVALALALEQQVPRPEKSTPEDEAQELVGQAEGLARRGDWGPARERLKAANRYGAEVQLRVLVGLAAAAPVGAKAEDKSDLEAAVALAGKMKGRPEASGPLLRLARLAARAGLPEDQQLSVAAAIAAPAPRGLAQLAVLRARLASAQQVVGEDAAAKVDGKGLAHLLAREALARHNVRRDGGWAKVVQGWEEPERSFGSLGVALGMQGKD